VEVQEHQVVQDQPDRVEVQDLLVLLDQLVLAEAQVLLVVQDQQDHQEVQDLQVRLELELYQAEHLDIWLSLQEQQL
jgi:hypothetical protein